MKQNIAHWKIGGISIPGFSHLENNIPCQDYNIVSVSKFNCIIGVVADGAGSAKHSDIGAKYFSEVVFDFLNTIENLHLLDETKLNIKIVETINLAKQSLLNNPPNGLKTEDIDIKDFATTMVAFLANDKDGYFIHLGDGVGVSFLRDDYSNCFVSEPHNGEYSNETYFLTMDNWENYLRIKKFNKNFDAIILMSDGVSPMAMTKGCKEPYEGFVKPIINYIDKVELEKSNLAIKNTLESEQIRKITHDDKTFVWALKS